MYPVGQAGLTAVTFLTKLPFTHVIVSFLATVVLGVGVGVGVSVTTGAGVEVGVGVGATTFSCVNFTLIVGLEKLKP